MTEKEKQKKEKKERAEKIKKIRENKLIRKKRVAHLFMLGNLFKNAGMDHLDEETLIGYCLSFQKINPLKINQYKIIGNKILIEKEIERQEKAKKIKNIMLGLEKIEVDINFNKEEFKKKIFKLGIIFEMTKIDTVEVATLIGFILDFKNKNDLEKKNFYFDGKLFKLEREK